MTNKYLLTLLVLSAFTPLAAKAASPLRITPTIIDEVSRPNGIIKHQIKIKNAENQKYAFFVFVNDFSPESGVNKASTSVSADKKSSLASWTSIRRSFDLDPNAEMELPLEIDVAPDAIPGKYFEKITFGVGSNAPEAEGQIGNGAAELMVGVDIEKPSVEKMQLAEFKPVRNIFFEYPINLSMTLDNIGNADLEPRGSIYIYNRSGQEVDKINIEGFKVLGGEKKSSIFNWDTTDKTGKFKARLELEYGNETKRDIQDSINFWIFPFRLLIIWGISLFAFVFFLTYFLFRKSYKAPAYDSRDDEYDEYDEDAEDEAGDVLDLRRR